MGFLLYVCMAKVTHPLHSISATGKLGGGLRYAKSRGQARAIAKRSSGATESIGQQRQSAIIAEAGRLWRREDSTGPEFRYQEYVGNISRADWFFWFDAVLLSYDDNQLLTV